MANNSKPPRPTAGVSSAPSASGPASVISVGAAVFVLLLWMVTQNGVAVQNPGAFFAVFALVAGSLPVLAALWLGAAGYGFALRALLIPGRRGGVIEELALGMAALLAVNWLVAWAGLLTQNGAVAVFGAGCLLNLLKFLPTPDEQRVERRGLVVPWSVLLCVPGLVLLVVAASCPPGSIWRVEAFGYDVTSYHLQLPREWMALGAMTGLEHNVYSFLPSLIEGGYLLIGTLSGSVLDGVYTCQLFHVTLALLAAAAIGKLVAARSSASVGAGAAGLFLAIPWVTITGSMAYNEMGVLAFGAAALLIVFGGSGPTRGGAVAVGLLVGAATLAKLTAGVMVAVPVGLILLIGLNRRADTPNSPARKGRVGSKRSVMTTGLDTKGVETPPPGGGDGVQKSSRGRWCWNIQLAAIAALAGALMLSPYLVRNYMETGNPVFPFAAERLGTGHWDQTLVERWDTAHGLSPKQEGRLDALGRQWLLNTGYGAIGGKPTMRETQNMARFDNEGGVPALWIVVAIAGVLLLKRQEMRRAGLGLGLMLGVQVLFWMFATHMQSRFLLPTILPACVLAGLGYERLVEATKRKAPTVGPVVGAAVVVMVGLVSYTTMVRQARTVTDPDTGQEISVPISVVIDAPIVTSPGDPTAHPINRLPAGSKTLLVADNSGLLYLTGPIVYATAFDEAPLGRVIRAAGGDPKQVASLLQDQGITHVWVHWAELYRLHRTYGHDADVTIEGVLKLVDSGWKPVETIERSATLYALPVQKTP
jgi:hypothetical protein